MAETSTTSTSVEGTRVTYDSRQAEPGQTFVFHDYDGERVEVKADSSGVIKPTSEAEVRLADAFGLPPARAESRAAKAESKAAKTAEGS